MEKFDLLGGKLNFYSNKEESMRSKFGGTVTIILVVILSLLIAGFGQDFFKRTDPQLVLSTVSPTQYPEFTLTNKNFSFSFRIEDIDGNAINRPDLFYTKVTYNHYDKNENGVWITKEKYLLDTPSCTKDMFFDNADFVIDIGTLHCPQFKNLTVGGYWDSYFVKRFQIETFNCYEGSFTPDKMPCGSNEEREKFLKNKIYLSLYYQSTVINPNDYKSGLRSVIQNNYYTLDKYLYKNPYYFFEESELITDYGWLIKDITIVSVLGIKEITMDINTAAGFENGSFSSVLTRAVVYFSSLRRKKNIEGNMLKLKL